MRVVCAKLRNQVVTIVSAIVSIVSGLIYSIKFATKAACSDVRLLVVMVGLHCGVICCKTTEET